MDRRVPDPGEEHRAQGGDPERAGELPHGTVDDRFDFTVGLMVDGLPGARPA
jgi:hypothetical protein